MLDQDFDMHQVVAALLQGFNHNILAAHFQVRVIEVFKIDRVNADCNHSSAFAHALTKPASDGTSSRTDFSASPSFAHPQGFQLTDRSRVGQRGYAFQPHLVRLHSLIQDLV